MTRAFFFDEKAPKGKGYREHQQVAIDGGAQYIPLSANQWREAILTFGKYHVIKMPKVFQGLFYMLGFTREDICERDTNKIEWKKARKILLGPNTDGGEFFKRIGDYNPFGPKEEQSTLYQKLRFLKKTLKKHEQEIEKVEEYSIPLSKLFKWMLYSIELRAQDVVHRRELKNKFKEERKVAEEAANERERNRREACEHARNVRIIHFNRTFRSMKPRRRNGSHQLRAKARARMELATRRRSVSLTRKSSSANGTLNTPRLRYLPLLLRMLIMTMTSPRQSKTTEISYSLHCISLCI